MESTGSNSPATDTSLQSPAPIRGERKKLLARHGPSSSRPRAPSYKVIIIPEFKCMYCPRRFATARGRGGHERVHRHLRAFRQKQKQKERRRLAPGAGAGPQLRVSASRTGMHYFPAGPARSGSVPLLAGAGGLAPAQPSSAAPGGGHVGISRQVDREKTAQCYSWLRSFGVSSSVLPQPPLAALAPAVAEGDGAGAGDGIRLGGLQAIPDLNQEAETTDEVDLTLRL